MVTDVVLPLLNPRSGGGAVPLSKYEAAPCGHGGWLSKTLYTCSTYTYMGRRTERECGAVRSPLSILSGESRESFKSITSITDKSRSGEVALAVPTAALNPHTRVFRKRRTECECNDTLGFIFTYQCYLNPHGMTTMSRWIESVLKN